MYLQLWQIEALIELVEDYKLHQAYKNEETIWQDILDQLNSELFKLST